jgi:hypothetical protein
MAERAPDGELSDSSLGDLIKQLTQDVGNLARQEIELAKAEMSAKARQAGAGAGMLGGATVAALMALGALTACLILALNLVLPASVAALIVAVLWGIGGAILAARGRDRLKAATPPSPEGAIESVKEDVQWMKTRASETR